VRPIWDGTPVCVFDGWSHSCKSYLSNRRCNAFSCATRSGASSAAQPAVGSMATPVVDHAAASPVATAPAPQAPTTPTPGPDPIPNAAPAAAERKVMQDLATYEFSVDGASSEAVAKVIADPKTWVTLMGMPEETVPELLGSGSDFKCVRDDGKTCYMTNVVSKEGDREGDKVFAYTTSLTHTDLGDAGLAAPIFTVKHEFSMSSSSNGCVVKRVCTDFEQNEMLEVDLGSMLKGGMITKENATLVALCTASAQQDPTTG